jgi:hypothetical protein
MTIATRPDLSAEAIWAMAESMSLSVRDAVDRTVKSMDPDQIRDFVLAQVTRSAMALARRRVVDLTTTPEQLALFVLGHEFPRMIRVEREDTEEFVPLQFTTLAEVRGHDQWVYHQLQRKLGVHERGMTRRQQLDLPDDVPLGSLVYTAPCPVCHEYWAADEADPFEMMHDQPVAGRPGASEVHWGHRRCNSAEGIK